MRRLRLLATFVVPILALLICADPALAVTHGGEGLYGPTNDVEVTNAMFFLIIFFPSIIIIFSLIQAWLDRRKHAKWDKQKAEMEAHPVKGGW